MIVDRPRDLWFELDSEERQIIGALRDFCRPRWPPPPPSATRPVPFPLRL